MRKVWGCAVYDLSMVHDCSLIAIVQELELSLKSNNTWTHGLHGILPIGGFWRNSNFLDPIRKHGDHKQKWDYQNEI